MVKRKKKTKDKKPKIYVTKTGRRYIKMNKKRYYIEDGISERELLKFIVSKLAPKRRKRKAGVGKDIPSDKLLTSVVSSGFNDAKLRELSKEIEKNKNALVQTNTLQKNLNKIEQRLLQPANRPLLMVAEHDKNSREQLSKYI